MAKRKFSKDYIKFGFTLILDYGEEKRQCVLCYKILGKHSLSLPKLMLHFEKVHSEHKIKMHSFAKEKKLV